MSINRENLAWAAGFMDGEGSFSIRSKRTRSAQIQVHINQNHPEPLSRFRDAVGVGRVYGPYARQGTSANHSLKPRFEYFAHSFEDTQAILAMLWPWLGSVKKEQAKRCFRAKASECIGESLRGLMRDE